MKDKEEAVIPPIDSPYLIQPHEHPDYIPAFQHKATIYWVLEGHPIPSVKIMKERIEASLS